MGAEGRSMTALAWMVAAICALWAVWATLTSAGWRRSALSWRETAATWQRTAAEWEACYNLARPPQPHDTTRSAT